MPDDAISMRPDTPEHATRGTAANHQHAAAIRLCQFGHFQRNVARADAHRHVDPNLFLGQCVRLLLRQTAPASWAQSTRRTCLQSTASRAEAQAPRRRSWQSRRPTSERRCRPHSNPAPRPPCECGVSSGSGASSMWTPVSTGQSASCSTFAVIEPNIKRRKPP